MVFLGFDACQVKAGDIVAILADEGPHFAEN